MKNTFLNDAKNAFKLFKNTRKARKNGVEIMVQEVEEKRIPVIDSTAGFYDTVEGCVLSHCERDVHNAVRKVFSKFTREEKQKLAFSPKTGEFVDRANFWSDKLKSALTQKQYHIAMCQILHWYIHIKSIQCGRAVLQYE